MRLKGVIAVIIALLALVSTASAGGPALAQQPVLVPAVQTPYPGKIFVAHDEWPLSDYGYELSRAGARQLTLNLARWFTGGRPGRFLVYSSFHALIGHEMAATMTAAGHSWTIDASAPFTVASLLQYDAVFVGGTPADNGVLIDYVRAGGNVFIEGGTGLGGWFGEAAEWNTFLNAFGLAFGDIYDYSRPAGVYPVASSSPIFNGVTALYEDTGSPILKLDPSDPNVQILVPYGGHALYATYSATVIPIAVESCPGWLELRDRAPLAMTIVGTPDFDVRKLDASSLRVVNVAARQSALGFGYSATPGPRLGKTKFTGCQLGLDSTPDLTLWLDNHDVVRSVEALLGAPLEAGDVVALTVTGRLKPQYGGTPVLGEGLVVVRDHGWAWGRSKR